MVSLLGALVAVHSDYTVHSAEPSLVEAITSLNSPAFLRKEAATRRNNLPCFWIYDERVTLPIFLP
jgi:hypothetical protein